MAEYLSPGVYMEEFDTSVKPMVGVSTSTAGFIGITEYGPLTGTPQLITSFADYQRKFGGYLRVADYGPWRYLPFAVEQFFANGGRLCYVVRVLPGMEEEEEAKRPSKAAWSLAGVSGGILTLKAKNEGAWGNRLSLSFIPNPTVTAKINLTSITGKAKWEGGQILEGEGTEGNGTEEKITLTGTFKYDREAPAGKDIKTGSIVRVQVGEVVAYGTVLSLEDGNIRIELNCQDLDFGSATDMIVATPEFDINVLLSSELWEIHSCISLDNGAAGLNTALEKSGFVTVGESILPDGLSLYSALVDHTFTLTGGRDCAAGKKVMDLMDVGPFRGTDLGQGKRSGIPAFKDLPDVNILLAPGLTDQEGIMELVSYCENQKNCVCILDMPGGMAGVQELKTYRSAIDSSYAAMYHPWIQDFDRIEKQNQFFPPSGAMAGIYARTDNSRGVNKAPANEIVRSCTNLQTEYGKAEQDLLNPAGINLIRKIQGQGIRIWGARTCSSEAGWKYINVRRFSIFLEQTIYRNAGWAVSEPNDQKLWTRLSNTITSFLHTLWKDGALLGTTPEEAYYVQVGEGSSMTKDDIQNGRLVCIVGVALVRPADYYTFRFTLKMEEQS